MSYDGLVLHSLIDELNEKFIGARVDRIYQQEKDELLLYLRSRNERGMLLLSASGSYPRAYLTEYKKENPKEPPMFCMLLRKHLQGSRILGFRQYKMDRIMAIDLECKTELGDLVTRSLIIEIMGRHSNIIFVEGRRILDAITRVNKTMSSLREILPGKTYEVEVLGNKDNPLEETSEEFLRRLDRHPKAENGFRFLMSQYTGISPLIAREILYRASIDENLPLSAWEDEERNSLKEVFFSFIETVKQKEYKYVAVRKGTTTEFSVIDLKQFSRWEQKVYSSVSKLLDDVYRERDLFDRLGQKSQALRKSVKTHLERGRNKQKKLWKEYEEALDREKYKIYGDVLSANTHLVEKGASEVYLPNFYTVDLEEIRIPLDPKLSPIANAGKFYKRYSKLKHAAKLLEEQMEENKTAMDYLENTLVQIEMAETPGDIDEIRKQYRQDFQKKSSNSKKKSSKEALPMIFETPEGSMIYVGKNNRQNEDVTFKIAARDDLWFHVKEHPGSHVILKCPTKEYKDKDMLFAARLAAYYSSLKNNPHVDVDYTFRKNIKRHPSHRPGLVNYVNYRTIHVSGSQDVLDELKRLQ